jgi:hypothetical protein
LPPRPPWRPPLDWRLLLPVPPLLELELEPLLKRRPSPCVLFDRPLRLGPRLLVRLKVDPFLLEVDELLRLFDEPPRRLRAACVIRSWAAWAARVSVLVTSPSRKALKPGRVSARDDLTSDDWALSTPSLRSDANLLKLAEVPECLLDQVCHSLVCC